MGKNVSFGAWFSVPLAAGAKADQLRCALEPAWMRGAWGGALPGHPQSLH